MADKSKPSLKIVRKKKTKKLLKKLKKLLKVYEAQLEKKIDKKRHWGYEQGVEAFCNDNGRQKILKWIKRLKKGSVVSFKFRGL